jgi:hypothetical protein
MAQHDYNIANGTFPAVRTDINNALSAIQTTNSGTSRPTGAVAGQLWLDTTNTTAPTLKFYDGADDISFATIDYTANTVNWLDSTVSITGLSTTATGTVLSLSDSANTSTVNLIIDNDKEIRFREATANGTNYIGLSAPSSVSADLTFTLPATDGTSGQALVTNGSGVLSFSNVGGGTFTATASGAITQGDVVALQSDGTVFTPAGTDYASLTNQTTLQSFTGQTPTNLADDTNSSIASNSTGSLLLQVVQLGTGADLQVIAGTVSAGIITWGTPLSITGITIQPSSAMNVTFDVASGNFVIYYFGSANTLSVQAISVSGTTCTAGTAVTRASIDDDVRSLPAYYDSTAGKNVVLVHSSSTQYPSAIVVTLSGTTVTLATTVVITSTASTVNIIWSDCFYNSTLNKGIFLYHNASSVVSIALGTISAGVISFGTSLSSGLTISNAGTSMANAVPHITYDNDQSKVLMVYVSSNSGTIYSYTVSGTTLTASTTYSISSSSASLYGVYYLSAKKALVMMGIGGLAEVFYLNTTTGTYIEDTIYTTNFGAITPINSPATSLYGKILYLTSGQRFAFYQVAWSAGCTIRDMKTTIGVFDIPTTNLYINGTTTNPTVLGISSGTYSNGNTATINYFAGGSIYTHSSSSFTINTTYYKSYGNTFTTTSTGRFSNSGVAVATNKLITSTTSL